MTAVMIKPVEGKLAPHLTVEVLSGADQIQGLASQWDALLRRSSGATPYVSRAWVMTAIKESPAVDHRIVCVRGDQELHALWPLRLRSFGFGRIAEGVGEKRPSFLGVLADPARPEALSALAEWVARQRLFQAMVLRNVSTVDTATHAIISQLVDAGWRSCSRDRFICWRTELESTLEDFLLRQRSGKSRRKLRWKENTLSREHCVEVQEFAGSEISDSLVGRVVEISRASEKHGRGIASLDDPFNLRFLLDAAAEGIASVWLMRVDDEDAACIAGFRVGDTYFYKWPAHRRDLDDRLSVGYLLLLRCIGGCCVAGLQTFDFGHGTFEYKKALSNERYQTRRIALGRGLRGRLVVAAAKRWWGGASGV